MKLKFGVFFVLVFFWEDCWIYVILIRGIILFLVLVFSYSVMDALFFIREEGVYLLEGEGRGLFADVVIVFD